jgi:regulator of protease activity HflC (stomatin/prohibitin superfamily)
MKFPNFSFSSPQLVGMGIAGFIGVAALLGSFYQVYETERGVILRNGRLVGVAAPGLGFKVPLIDNVVHIAVTTQTTTWEKMNSYSADQQPADLKVSVTYHPVKEKVDAIYARFGSVENAVKTMVGPHLNQQVKIVFGQFTAVKAVQERGKLNRDVKDAVTASLGFSDLFEIEGIQVENIDFSPTYLKSIEERMLAEVEVQKLRQNAEREKVQADITETKAKAEANAKLANANAESEAIRVRGNAQAEAIKARAAALADNPLLIQLTLAEKWNGQAPTSVIPGTTVPMIGLGTSLK